jgi:quercetin dioxygenase-like cupin family protein
MQILDVSSQAGFSEERFDSQRFTVTPLLRHAASVAVLYLAAGGCIGRHPAVGHQVLMVVEGRGTVSSSDGVEQTISAGQAAVWGPGESHETRTSDGLTAVVSEGPDVLLLLPLPDGLASQERATPAR